MPSLANWLGSAAGGREADTLARIAEEPLAVAWWRDGVQIGTLTVRAVTRSDGAIRRGPDSGAIEVGTTILAPAGTDLRAEDRLEAPNAVAYLITSVPPGQRWQVEAAAEVASR